MTVQRSSDQIVELFDELVQRTPDERPSVLRAARCSESDRQLLARMLAQHERLTVSPGAAGDRGLDDAVRAALAPRAMPQVPRFELLAPLGEGGHGVVYLARAIEPPERLVALKVLRADLDSGSALRRFEAERVALAELDHPAIVSISDAGTTADGRPYFAMPVVHGEPLTEVALRGGMPARARVELLRAAIAGVVHAHGRGILHRDLKPGNILAEAVEGGWRVRIIDWGLARAIHGAENARAELRTQAIGGAVGTPEFMSPEQASGGAAGGDARSDVWSLGVVLYLLLAGVLPFAREEVRGLSPSALARHLHAFRPPLPSRAARTAADAQAARGDLDAIAMMALEPDPSRRYQTVAALADDLDAWLAGRGVRARPESSVRQLARLARRHRVAAASATLAVVALFVATTVSIRSAIQARDSLRSAETSAVFLEEILRGIEPALAQGRDRALLLEVLRTATARLPEYDARDPVGAARVRLALARAWNQLGYSRIARDIARRGFDDLAEIGESATPLARGLDLERARAHATQSDIPELIEAVPRILRGGAWPKAKPFPTDPESCEALLLAVRRNLGLRPDLRMWTELDAPPEPPSLDGIDASSDAICAHLDDTLGPGHPIAIEARVWALRYRLDPDPHGPWLDEIVRIFESTRGRPELAVSHARAAVSYTLGLALRGRATEVRPFVAKELPALEALLGPEHPTVLNLRWNGLSAIDTVEEMRATIPDGLACARAFRRGGDPNGGMSTWVLRAVAVWCVDAGDEPSLEALRAEYIADCARLEADPTEVPRLDAELARLRARIASPADAPAGR